MYKSSPSEECTIIKQLKAMQTAGVAVMNKVYEALKNTMQLYNQNLYFPTSPTSESKVKGFN